MITRDTDLYTSADLGLTADPDDGPWVVRCACGESAPLAGVLPEGWVERNGDGGIFWLCPACIDVRQGLGADCICECAACVSAHGTGRHS